ncbi:MAG: PD-(D/E)XK nuclease family protein [Candidatus Hodarchaeota archaeon]
MLLVCEFKKVAGKLIFATIFDWKTSDEPKGDFPLSHEHRQASFYALWPHLEMGHPIEGIEIAVVYVGGEKPNAYSLTVLPEDIEGLLADAELLVSACMEYLDAEKRFGLGDFDWATSARACFWCPFQQICQRELE